jgi:hypothetical protein
MGLISKVDEQRGIWSKANYGCYSQIFLLPLREILSFAAFYLLSLQFAIYYSPFFTILPFFYFYISIHFLYMKFILYLFHIRCPKEIDRMRWVDSHFTCRSGSLSVDPQIEPDKRRASMSLSVGRECSCRLTAARRPPRKRCRAACRRRLRPDQGRKPSRPSWRQASSVVWAATPCHPPPAGSITRCRRPTLCCAASGT